MTSRRLEIANAAARGHVLLSHRLTTCLLCVWYVWRCRVSEGGRRILIGLDNNSDVPAGAPQLPEKTADCREHAAFVRNLISRQFCRLPQRYLWMTSSTRRNRKVGIQGCCFFLAELGPCSYVLCLTVNVI